MTWLRFCELFTIINLGLLAVASVIALLIAIVYLGYSIVDFVKKIKQYFEDFDILKERFNVYAHNSYIHSEELEREIKKLKKGGHKTCK